MPDPITPYSKTTWATGNTITATAMNKLENQLEAVTNLANALEAAMRSSSEENSKYHLGFYIDDEGYLCQIEEVSE